MNTSPYNLQRFLDAQQDVYQTVIQELRAGRKRTHWIWFIFPQVTGLGVSATARFYAIQDSDEAQAYLAHPVLGNRLVECTNIVLSVEGKSALDIFGGIDAMKFRSSMTLFAAIADSDPVFQQAIDKYFAGDADAKTLEILRTL